MAQPTTDRSVFDEAKHPRVPSGGAGGGEFGTSSSKKAAPKSTAKKAPARMAHAATKTVAKPTGPLTSTLSFDAKNNRGAGYGMPHGDPHVKKIQAQLNHLGLLDLHGKKLLIDGKLGPRTTASIKSAERKFGLKADGKLTPALYAKLLATKSMPKGPSAKPVAVKKVAVKKVAEKAPAVIKPPAKRSEVQPMAPDDPEDPNVPDLNPNDAAADSNPGPTMSDDDCEQELMNILGRMSAQEIYDLVGMVEQALNESDGSN